LAIVVEILATGPVVLQQGGARRLLLLDARKLAFYRRRTGRLVVHCMEAQIGSKRDTLWHSRHLTTSYDHSIIIAEYSTVLTIEED